MTMHAQRSRKMNAVLSVVLTFSAFSPLTAQACMVVSDIATGRYYYARTEEIFSPGRKTISWNSGRTAVIEVANGCRHTQRRAEWVDVINVNGRPELVRYVAQIATRSAKTDAAIESEAHSHQNPMVRHVATECASYPLGLQRALWRGPGEPVDRHGDAVDWTTCADSARFWLTEQDGQRIAYFVRAIGGRGLSMQGGGSPNRVFSYVGPGRWDSNEVMRREP
ncbi:MAG: hypothetical protein J0H01_12305 [Rhizobiales bacterium]|nr:hypothetical protein [Hyphomicrobiales bacterium]